MVVLGMLYVFSTVFYALILRVSAVTTDGFSSRGLARLNMDGAAGTQALDKLTHLKCDLAGESLLLSH